MPKVALLLHLGNHDKWTVLSKYVQNVYSSGANVNLYLSYQYVSPVLDQIKMLYPGVKMVLSANGCDIGGQLKMFQSVSASNIDYDYLLLMHSKSDLTWREQMLDPICGSISKVTHVYNIFEDQSVGIVGSHRWRLAIDLANRPIIIQMCKDWGLNVDFYESDLFESLYRAADHRAYNIIRNGEGHELVQVLPTFIGGTIFWLRWSVYKRFFTDYHINLEKEYQRLEPKYMINNIPTRMHSWERIFGLICYIYNKRVHGIFDVNSESDTLDDYFYHKYYGDFRHLNWSYQTYQSAKIVTHWNNIGKAARRYANYQQLIKAHHEKVKLINIERSERMRAIIINDKQIQNKTFLNDIISMIDSSKCKDFDIYVDGDLSNHRNRRMVYAYLRYGEIPPVYEDLDLKFIYALFVNKLKCLPNINFYLGYPTDKYKEIILTDLSDPDLLTYIAKKTDIAKCYVSRIFFNPSRVASLAAYFPINARLLFSNPKLQYQVSTFLSLPSC